MLEKTVALFGRSRPVASPLPAALTELPSATIRTYRPSDRAAVRKICCDTGFLGRPIETLFRDRELFADLLTAPYLDCEPEWSLVVEKDGEVVGYLLASVNRFFALHQLRCGFATVCRMLGRLVAGSYADHPRSRQYVRWVLTAGGRERPRHPAHAAHLHFNLVESCRGRFLGKHLWEAFDRRLRAAGISQVYGEFYSYPGRRPERAYARYGFTVFDRRKTTLFQPEIPDPVHVVCALRQVPKGPADS